MSLEQALQEQRIERTAFAVQDHLDSLFVAERWLIDAFAGERVVDVCERDHLCRDGDLVSFEAIRIAASVIAFVVPARNLA